MRMILITGGTGLVGSELKNMLESKGMEVKILSTKKETKHSYWNPTLHIVDKDLLFRAKHLIHLAGANIGAKRWSKARKIELYNSRVESLNFLYNQFKSNSHSLESVISSSAIGFYGLHTNEHIYSENDKSGDDFLGTMSRDWESAALQFNSLGVRTAVIRAGIVLSKSGGILKKILPFTGLGLGSFQGTGKQYMPWIHLNDLCRIYLFAITNSSIVGSYNGVAPCHVNNYFFNKQLVAALRTKIFLPPIPEWLLSMAFGEMANLIIKGSKVSSEKICGEGFDFIYTDLRKSFNEIFI
tara:strand:- start:19 stop:912 length:894 start_codon:yes stop_codon:yes gene_type:complete